MLKLYLVEISHERITPITVLADSIAEAKDAALNNSGEPGDEYSGDSRIIAVRCLDEGGDQ